MFMFELYLLNLKSMKNDLRAISTYLSLGFHFDQNNSMIKYYHRKLFPPLEKYY